MKRRVCIGFLCLLLTLITVLALPSCSPAVSNKSDESSQLTSTDGGQSSTGSEQGSSSDKQEAASDDQGSIVLNEDADAKTESQDATATIDENGTYTSKDEVALYIHTYGHLPSNYVTKDEAEDAGWKTEGLDLDEACPGKSIGGDRFGNREGKLPKAKGRVWYECDIDFNGRSRGAKRIVYSNDGLIYYTEDHYSSFEQLY